MSPRARSLAGLVFFLGLCLIVSALGGMVTATSVGTWYQGLTRPPFNPPDWIFAPVWSTLFVLMALAGWRVWKIEGVGGARRELGMFAVQLSLNLGWSVVFFGLRLPGWAFGEMIVLFAAIVATLILFWRRDRLAGGLIVPYVGWVAFALYLNGAIWWLN